MNRDLRSHSTGRNRFASLCQLLDLHPTPEQAYACYWLESHGLRFCVDFGLENAWTLAEASWWAGMSETLQ